MSVFQFTTKENEQIETIVQLPKEPRSVIHGVVKDWEDKIVKNAVVKLFEVKYSSNITELKPLTHTFTDEEGQFVFGPLTPNKQYVIKVWVNNVEIRHINLEKEDYEENFF